MRIKEVKLFTYGELSDKAKERARSWYRESSRDDSFWSECAIDDAKEQLKFLGFEVDEIYWSGFWSQGDGACFTGTWRAKDVAKDKLHPMFLEDYLKELAEAHAELLAIAKEYPEAYASLTHHDRYCHENTIRFDCGDFERERETEEGDIPVWDSTAEHNFEEAARDCMRWIYHRLEKEYDWQNADEQVAENIIANEYEFTEEGEIA